MPEACVPQFSSSLISVISRSLFAAFFGNIVGALFIAIPYTHFYLSDYQHGAGGLEDAEEGNGPGHSGEYYFPFSVDKLLHSLLESVEDFQWVQ